MRMDIHDKKEFSEYSLVCLPGIPLASEQIILKIISLENT